MIKRIFDIVASGIGILILSPVFVVISVWIKLDSTGSVFYRQIRVGRNNVDFKLFKFRSMRVGADKKGLLTVGDRDTRVTRFGYYLRKYKLDELPQLINVFIGDMSLVGPRPEVRKYVDLYTEKQMCILNVRPGITDMASIRYRNETVLLEQAEDPETYYREIIMQDKLKINEKYIVNSSFWIDLGIIFKTIIAVVKKS